MDLEQAAETILAPPNLVTDEQRKGAEAVFNDLKGSLTIDNVQQVLYNSHHPFILHQIGTATGELVLRDWPILEPAQIEGAYKMLVEFVATRDNLPVYVVAEILRSTAMIIKRGIIDHSTGDPEVLYETIRGLLSSPEARMQSIGCQLISSLCEQFSSSWRNSKFSITWDFHLSAKTAFENTGLRRLLEMAVTTLYSLVENSDILNNEFEKRLCEKFLEVAESAFSWNFSARLFRRIFSMHQTSTSFRPPRSWSDLLSNDQFFILFFKLHSKIRTDENLSMHSLSCLVQIASLSGEVITNTEFAQHFIGLFVENLLNLFPQGPSDHEMDYFCTLINRLFLYRPIQTLMRLPSELRSRFLSYIAQYIEHLTMTAMHDAIATSSHSKHTSLVPLFDSWNTLLRGKWRSTLTEEEVRVIEDELISAPTWSIIRAFFNATQSPPIGSRPKEINDTNGDNDEDEDDETKDDRILYADLLTTLSGFVCYCLPLFLHTHTSALRERLTEFSRMANGSVDTSGLSEWQEDMHWLMLMTATSMVGEDIDGSCHIQSEVFDHSINLCKERGSPFLSEARDTFLSQCIENPTSSREESAGHVDPFIIMIGELFAWASLEHQLITSTSLDMVSPELCRSTTFALKRVLNAASSMPEADDQDAVMYPLLPTNGPTAELIVNFILTKTFVTIEKFSGEKRLCSDAVSMLNAMVECHAPTLASSPTLFAYLGELDISKCTVRAELMKVLVLIGAAACSDELRQNMFTQILQPLATRFSLLLSQHSTSPSTSSGLDSDMVDLLQCFDGVVKASQSHSATILFKVVEPVLDACPGLVRSCSSAPVVTAVLTLMQDVTTKISIYIDDKADSMKLYTSLLQTVEAYRSTHAQRFVGMTSDDDEKAADLVLFMEILSNVLSNDILENADDRQLTGSQVAMTSLEMLLCVMSEALLQHPEVAIKFYRLLLYLAEFCPESLAFINDHLLNAMCECLKSGLTSKYGNEITSVCLESLAGVAAYYSNNRDKCTPGLIEHFRAMMPMTFEAVLDNSAEASVFSEACSCLYTLICFDKDFFNSFAQELLQRKNNEKAATKLAEAFGRLFPSEPILGRRERIAFRQRMEKFLGEIQGLLWLH